MDPPPPAPSQAENGLAPWLEGGRDLFKKPTSSPRRRAEGVKGVLPCPSLETMHLPGCCPAKLRSAWTTTVSHERFPFTSAAQTKSQAGKLET